MVTTLNSGCPQASKHPSKYSKYSKYSKMSSYSKKFVASFIRDYIGPYSQPKSIVKLFDTSLQEVKVQAMSPYDTYTTISINPYTLEERLNTYPVVPLSGYGLEAVVVHSSPPHRYPYVVINVE